MALPQIITAEIKEGIYNDLADAMIVGLKNGVIFTDDASSSADYVLKNLETISDKDQLMGFLAILSKKWDVYKDVYLKIKKEDLIDKVQSELKQIEQ